MRRTVAGVVVLLAALTAAAPGVRAAAIPPVTVFAHRGGAGIAPENTLGAFRLAHDLYGERGVWLELDTWPTADGHLVVIHDSTLDRTTTCSGPVLQRTLAELAECDASVSFPGWPQFEAVPTLESVLIAGKAAGWRIMVEIKNAPGDPGFELLGIDAAHRVTTLVRGTGFPQHRLVVQSFWPPNLDRVESTLPRVRTALLTGDTLPSAPSGVGVPVIGNAIYSTLRGYEIVAPEHTSTDMGEVAVTVAHTLGRKIVPYTPNTAAAISRMADAGVDGVITDRPDIAYEVL